MKRVLHILSTPRSENSNTLSISKAFLDSLKAKDSETQIEEIDLFNENLPAVAGDNIETKYSLMVGQPISPDSKESWESIEKEIARFLSADLIVMSVPMWNFSIPYTLKYYIDSIVQPGYLFKYNEQGVPEGLATGKKMVVIMTSGGDYSPGGPMAALNFVEPYLRAIFGFCGITDIQMITAGPMDFTPEIRQQAIMGGVEQAKNIAVAMT